MAASVVMQSALTSSLNKTSYTTSAFPLNGLPPLHRNVNLQVKCKAQGDDKDEPLLSKLSPPPSQKVSPKLFDVMSFAGPAPERINGRLAMIGFVSAMAVEITKGQDLFTQIGNGGYQWFLWTSILFSMASLVPFIKGVGPGAKSNRFWNADAEVWNGRAAMIGLVALAATEFLKGGTLV